MATSPMGACTHTRTSRWLLRRSVGIGVVGAVLVFAGASLAFAFNQPPFVPADETAHLGYAQELAHLDLPEVTTFPDVPPGATQWKAERESVRDDRYRAVWVANHPPLFPLSAVPLIWLSNAMERADGGLLFLRLTNMCFAAAGVGLTFLLGREVAGGIGRIGVSAAAIAALFSQGQARFAEALNDGLAFALVTLVTLAGVRCANRGSGPLPRADLALLGAAAVACAGVRSAALLVAVAVVVLVTVLRLSSSTGPISRRARSAGAVAAVGLLPAALVFGWFYVRNHVLYGDFAGSQFLLQRFDRQPRGSLVQTFFDWDLWVGYFRKLLSPSPVFSIGPSSAILLVVPLAVLGLVLIAVDGRSGDRCANGRRGLVSRPALLTCVVVLLIVMLTVAQHVSGGGSRFARYLLPAIGVLATLIALGLDRLGPRVVPAVLVGCMGTWAVLNVPTGVDPAAVRRPRDRGSPMPELLQELPVSPWLRSATWVAIVAGLLCLLVSIARGLIENRRDHQPTRATLRSVAEGEGSSCGT